ncbi:MAG: hypothetical protein J0I77_09540 [Rudaea sp.]|uniref:hypothetical protein n=1 Tax=unclassified Rudaea TaxID=2627037 RepID=UPI0010F4F672|nr:MULTISPECIES: hypothetical protein [unclassified Rudaea]MBN8885950.1 hypothetical protein [Rudaea sp.]MBR0347046.1 hypothetical protein [Rudaea sp.]
MNLSTKIAKQLGLKIDEVLILQGADTLLLSAVARGKVDLNALAREELAARGLDAYGNWVGFMAAERALKTA